MGLDFGTGGVRAGLYDTSSGALIGVEEARYGTSHPRWGGAERPGQGGPGPPPPPHPVMAFSGGANAVEWLVPKAAWLARNEPQVYARAQRICEAQDFINFRLTGTWAASRLNACCKWNYDTLEKKFYP